MQWTSKAKSTGPDTWMNWGSFIAIVRRVRMTLIKRKRSRQEENDQILLATWLTRNGIRFTASANGGTRKGIFVKGKWIPTEGAKLKRMGVSKGYPDITIPIPSGAYHGLFLELKTDTGKLSAEQADWLNFLNTTGYYAVVPRSFEEAKNIVIKYLALTPKAA